MWFLFPLVQGARFEAEDGRYSGGVRFDSSIRGYSGRGYVTNFQNDGDKVTVTINVGNAGAYEVSVGYHDGFDAKGFDFQVGDEKGNSMFPSTGGSFSSVSIGKFFLPSGKSDVTISKGWGYYEVDYIDVNPTTINPPVKPPKTLVDPKATPMTQKLFGLLVDWFGSKQISGQTGESDIQWVRSITGKTPALGANDFMDYSPSRVEHGANATGTTERLISFAKSGNNSQIVSMHWHWNAPCDLYDQPGKEWWSGFYTYATYYDISYALDNTGSTEYQKLIRDLDTIAAELKKFQDANIPILWRPLHEAAGGWFWWGAKGPQPFKRLWRLMFERYTTYHNLHHLIWTFVHDTTKPDWYPGDDVVDIVGMDLYTDASSSMSSQWGDLQKQIGGKKLATLSESGTLPQPEKTRALAVWWSWFAVWSGDFIRKQPVDLIRRVYDDRDVLVLESLPKWRG